MKKSILSTIYFIAIVNFVQAQSKAEKMFQQTLAEYQKNPLKLVTENLSENYVLVSGSGYMASKSQLIALFKNVKSIDVTMKDLQVRQVGNTVIVNGNEHNVRHHSDGTPDLALDYVSTYVYEIKGNKLLGLSGQHTYPVLENIKTEEENIKNFLRQETIDAYALKTNEVANAFIQKPSTFRLWNIRTGYDTQFGWEAIEASNKKDFGAKPRIMNPENENFNFKFYGNNTAIVTYDQYLYGKNQKPSKELRILEKTDDKWKIAGLVALTDYSHNAFEDGLIKKTIETETKAYHEGNTELLMGQWADNEYIERQDKSLKVAGSTFFKGKDLTAFSDQFLKNHKPTGLTTKMSDYAAHMSGAQAWATFLQETINPDGTSRKTRELRILERIGGSWKIVLMSMQEI